MGEEVQHLPSSSLITSSPPPPTAEAAELLDDPSAAAPPPPPDPPAPSSASGDDPSASPPELPAPPTPPPLFDPSRMIGIIKRKALIRDLAAVYHTECLSYCQELLELQRKTEEPFAEVKHQVDGRKEPMRPPKRSRRAR